MCEEKPTELLTNDRFHFLHGRSGLMMRSSMKQQQKKIERNKKQEEEEHCALMENMTSLLTMRRFVFGISKLLEVQVATMSTEPDEGVESHKHRDSKSCKR